jgi:hypothetical protein
VGNATVKKQSKQSRGSSPNERSRMRDLNYFVETVIYSEGGYQVSKLEELAWETLAQIAPHADTDCDCFACEDGRKMIRSALLAFGEAVLERAAGIAWARAVVDGDYKVEQAIRLINLGDL